MSKSSRNIQNRRDGDRIDYIDLLKGVTIILVVWSHTNHPLWLDRDIVNITFFFLAGIFFKRKTFKKFINSKCRTLILPFLVFYVIAYPFRIGVHYWDNGEIYNYEFERIFDLFSVAARGDYLLINVPLWFLLALFFIELYYYFLSRLSKVVLFVTIVR